MNNPTPSRMRRRSPLLLAALLFLVVAPGWTQPAPAAPGQPAAAGSLEARVAALLEQLEARRVAHHIPGLAFVLVKDGEILVSTGLGVTDIDKESSVTPETLFMIGSTTKAFTATLVGMRVDDGKMAWDEPIVTYLPYFDPKVDSENEDDRVTLRDALSHRSGFARMSVLMTAQEMTPRELLVVANRAEPYDGFRKGFYYNNIMVMAAGSAAADTTNSDWHTLLNKRIFKPLGMKSSYSNSKKPKGKLQPGYLWDAEMETHDPQPILPIDVVGPAGSIVSNAEDMAKWIKFLLADGSYGGKQLIQPETLRETWVGNIPISQGVEYGMGWMIHDWQGRKVVEHGGNIHGFATQVGLIPEEGLGFALMTNLSGTPLQTESLGLVWEGLLGDPMDSSDAAADGAQEDLAKFTGKFVANFGPFQDTDFEVTAKDGALFVDVPGQTNYELKGPGEDGRRPFALTDTIAVSFESAPDDTVPMMRMHQGGLDFEIPRRGIESEVEIAPEELEPYLGVYKTPLLGGDVAVRVQNHRLAIDVPNQMVFELHLPGDGERRKFRIREVMSARFDRDEDGNVVSMTLFKGDEQIEVASRVGDIDSAPLPTVDEVIALRASAARIAAYEKAWPIRIEAQNHFLNAGLVSETLIWSDGPRYRVEILNGKFGWVRIALGDTEGEVQTHVTPIDPIDGRTFRAAQQNRLMSIQMPDWRKAFDKVFVLKRDKLEDRDIVQVRVENEDAPAMTLYVDSATGDVLRCDTGMPIPAAGMDLPLTMYFEDYREVGGLRIPHRVRTENPQEGRSLLTIGSFETGVAVCDALFDVRKLAACPAS